MSTVGLTKAMRNALEHAQRGYYDLIKRPTWIRINEEELVDRNGRLTTRGHAALAAPRMTKAELKLLELMERPSHEPAGHALGWIAIGSTQRRTAQRLRRSGLATFDCMDCWNGRLNTAGRTALNNVRAAMGSPDWKEGL